MTRPLVIDADDISLAYKLYKKPSDMLLESITGGIRHDTFWALRNVSLKVFEGQRVGLIGPNGAGKSTLLQIIAGGLAPTSGKSAVHGKISSLLSLSPVWSGEDNGIENIKFNLMVQGVPDSRIPAMIEDIIDFTELGAAMYRPVKTFSSGMSARLAFAIATASDPEILIVDEVLGAGDAYFIGKAMRRMEEFCERGKALLFVSHSTEAIRQFCDRAVWLENGSVRMDGDIDHVLKQYELDYRKAEDESLRAGNARDLQRSAAAFADASDMAWVQFRIVPANHDHFTDTHYVRGIRVEGLVEPFAIVNMAMPERMSDDVASVLDLHGSEWGRMFERRESATRLLSHAGGREPGGRFCVRMNTAQPGSTTPFAVDIEWASQTIGEPLALEFLDLENASWTRCAAEPQVKLKQGFVKQRFTGAFTMPESHTVEAVAKRIEDVNLPPVEIQTARLLTNDEPNLVVKEREPFIIEVSVLFRREIPAADIGLKITRSDGVYAYWQSSGQSGANLENALGEKLIRFVFDPNNFGAGEYFANVYVADGWDYPKNYPYGRIFDRKVSALQFKIFAEFGGLDFGMLNQRVPVEVR